MTDSTIDSTGGLHNPLDDLVAENPVKVSHKLVWAVMILLASSVAWSYFITLPEYAVAIGSVVPQSQIKVVQHLEGGIVQDIYVADGDSVNKGDPLIQLKLGSTGLNREDLQVRLDGLALTRARLKAESSGRDMIMPKDEAKRHPELASAELNQLDSRRGELESSQTVQRSQVTQAELAIKTLRTNKASMEKDLKISRDKLATSAGLLAIRLVTKTSHQELESAVVQLEGQVNTMGVEIPKAQSALKEAKDRVTELTLKFRREAAGQLSDIQQKIASARQLLSQASAQRLRTEIVSPIDGVIKNLAFNTVGGVVKAGEPIMQVVPTSETLVIEVHLAPEDRGYVEVGQKALVKVTSYDFIRYGGLDGRVTQISPDSDLDEQGSPYFLVKVSTERSYLGTKEGDLPITPGMQASVDIKTGDKSVMEYLVRPVLKIRYEAFHER
ncbi:MAG: HlyD family type I secretion periplasmic adaptor subunit [Alphaproteobacteria bacterium]|jgi:membrane fusion protein, adhesin transport system|nr:HlyD family type I secretion periplasmic adaptor subunit [Alphaproteobacteria bacterium]MBT5158948.1 HlyD family type I secretion periplasmic adaptor subunit [Alphaproteobacteria bacterium]MBT6387296.1 HlyD family type I secretion periplasmic adaptor subunit [Alphaproteobacteria bacterium]MBT7746048.1 HlyD family type I secretion periplasmic adaptor subunit [Alphaproteobacteria bacterium]